MICYDFLPALLVVLGDVAHPADVFGIFDSTQTQS